MSLSPRRKARTTPVKRKIIACVEHSDEREGASSPQPPHKKVRQSEDCIDEWEIKVGADKYCEADVISRLRMKKEVSKSPIAQIRKQSQSKVSLLKELFLDSYEDEPQENNQVQQSEIISPNDKTTNGIMETLQSVATIKPAGVDLHYQTETEVKDKHNQIKKTQQHHQQQQEEKQEEKQEKEKEENKDYLFSLLSELHDTNGNNALKLVYNE